MKNSSYERWMSYLPEEINISTLSLPGTHNSGAFFKLSPPSVRCQGESIQEQLTHGIRFLDIRLSKDYMSRGENVNDLMIVHGKFPVRLSGSFKFKQVLKEVYKFLDKNPTETILISVKFENTMLNWNENSDEFSKVLFEKFIGHNRNRWYLSDKIPTLKYCRGKVVLLRRFPVLENGKYKRFGIPSIWNYENPIYDDSNVCVQDYFEIKDASDINKKVNLIKDMIFKARDYHSSDESSKGSVSSSSDDSFNNSDNLNYMVYNNQQPKLFINFCTGANYFHKSFWPSNVDKAIRSFNIDDHYSKNCGIVVLDFADRDEWKLVKKLINVNIF